MASFVFERIYAHFTVHRKEVLYKLVNCRLTPVLNLRQVGKHVNKGSGFPAGEFPKRFYGFALLGLRICISVTKVTRLSGEMIMCEQPRFKTIITRRNFFDVKHHDYPRALGNSFQANLLSAQQRAKQRFYMVNNT